MTLAGFHGLNIKSGGSRGKLLGVDPLPAVQTRYQSPTSIKEGHRLALQIRRMISGERAHTLHVRAEERFDGRELPPAPILGVS